MNNNKKKKKRKPLLIILLVTTMLLAIYLTIYKPDWLNKPTFRPDETFHPIQISNEQQIGLFAKGFIVTGKDPAYYDWSGLQMNPPYHQDDVRDGRDVDNIIQATDNYILTDDGRIFKTTEIPFKLVYSNNDIIMKDIREFGEYLLVAALNMDDILEYYLLKSDSDFLLSFDGTASSVMLDADVHAGTKSLSLLSVSINTHLPVTRVFHYAKMHQPHGILTLEDTMMYKVHRLKDYVILVGNEVILCYNINGEQAWEIEKPGNIPYDTLKNDDQLLIYFREKIIDHNTKANAIAIDKSGNYRLLSFPRYISNIQAYKSIYIGINYNNTIVRMDRKGKILSRYRLLEGIKWLLPSKDNQNSFFVLTNDNVLKLYTTEIRKDDGD